MPLHHVEIWVAESGDDLDDWRWLLTELGYTCSGEWSNGETWGDEHETYLTLTGSPNLAEVPHDRRRPGVNHLAFTAPDPGGVDAIMRDAPDNGWTPLYVDRYPHAGGDDHYAAWLENAAGFKIEVVAAD